MMTPPTFLFCLTCWFMGEMAQMTELKISTVHQETSFISAKRGDSLTLQCIYKEIVAARFYWYKQTLGQKPRLISTHFKFEKNGTFHDEFKNNRRFKVDTEIGKISLKITDLHISDSAAYYCASSHSYKFEFAEGTFVNVEDSGLNISALVHQSASETIQPGGSVTLNCTVQTGTCDEEHSVYWFKTSEESHPGLIYTHGGKKDQCEKKANTQTHSCVYNLPLKSLNVSHAGTYYCAVASCGHILFGNGTRVDLKYEDSLVLVYILSSALAFTTILSVLLAFLICMINKKSNSRCSESQASFSAPSTANTEGGQNEESIHYAALQEHRGNRSRKQRNNCQTECVYSSVKQ